MASDTEASTPAPSSPAAKPKPKAKPKAKKPAAKKPAKAPAKKPVKAGKKAPTKKVKSAKKPVKKAAAKVAKKTGASHRGQGNAFINGPLYKMMKAKLPKKLIAKDGTIIIKELASAIKTSQEGVYRIFRLNSISPERAARIIKATASKIKGLDLLPFLLPKV